MSALPNANTRTTAANRLGAGSRVVRLRPVDFSPATASEVYVPKAPPSLPAQPPATSAPPSFVAREQDASSTSRAAPRPARATPWSVLVGLALLAADLVPELFRPLSFFATHTRVLGRAMAYLSVPTIATLSVYLMVPGMVSAFPLNSISGWLYLSCLFIATGISTCLFLAGLRGIGAGTEKLISVAHRRFQTE